MFSGYEHHSGRSLHGAVTAPSFPRGFDLVFGIVLAANVALAKAQRGQAPQNLPAAL